MVKLFVGISTCTHRRNRWNNEGFILHWNSKIDEQDMMMIGRRENAFQPTIGTHSLQVLTKDNGFTLIDMAATNNFFGNSTILEHKTIQNGAWKSEDGHTRKDKKWFWEKSKQWMPDLMTDDNAPLRGECQSILSDRNNARQCMLQNRYDIYINIYKEIIWEARIKKKNNKKEYPIDNKF